MKRHALTELASPYGSPSIWGIAPDGVEELHYNASAWVPGRGRAIPPPCSSNGIEKPGPSSGPTGEVACRIVDARGRRVARATKASSNASLWRRGRVLYNASLHNILTCSTWSKGQT